jgi:hypothetical protein
MRSIIVRVEPTVRLVCGGEGGENMYTLPCLCMFDLTRLFQHGISVQDVAI